MTYKEEKKDLFTVDFKEWTPAHCISRDCKMGAGIAVPMKKMFKLNSLINVIEKMGNVKVGECIYYNGVFNLITKKKYWFKPNMFSMRNSLRGMLADARYHNINKIVMPKIGSGLDKLNWDSVRNEILNIFADDDIDILVCYQ
jgi:hypothetical protein